MTAPLTPEEIEEVRAMIRARREILDVNVAGILDDYVTPRGASDDRIALRFLRAPAGGRRD